MATEPVVIARIAALPFDRLEDLGSTELAPEVESLLALREEIEVTASRLEASLFTAAGPPEALAPVGRGGSTAVASPPWRTLALHARRAVHQRRRSVLLEAAEEFRSPDPSMARCRASTLAASAGDSTR